VRTPQLEKGVVLHEEEPGTGTRITAAEGESPKTQLCKCYLNRYCILIIFNEFKSLLLLITPEELCATNDFFKNAQPIHIFYPTFYSDEAEFTQHGITNFHNTHA
jgi:hypothetical protein